jgi:hypothetical protein
MQKIMNKEIIKEEIRLLLEAINEQYDSIKNQQEKIPQIEFDIILENLRKLYENIHRLQKIEDHFHSTAATISINPVHPPIPTLQPSPPKTEVIQKKSPEPPVTVHVVKTPPRKSPPPEVPDLFEGEEPTFSIKLKEAREKTLGPKNLSSHVDNLKLAISINEKFMFINELFDGNLREYNETIDMLNGFTTLNQASEYLDVLKKKNFWDTGSQAFKKLSELVQRKY